MVAELVSAAKGSLYSYMMRYGDNQDTLALYGSETVSAGRLAFFPSGIYVLSLRDSCMAPTDWIYMSSEVMGITYWD